MLKRIVALTLSAALVALSPGLASYEAFGQAILSRTSVKTSGAPVTRLAPISVNSRPNTPARPAGIKLSAALPSLVSPTVKTAAQTRALALSAPARSQVMTGAAAAQRSPAPAPSALLSDKVAGLSDQVGSELQSAGDISRAGSENASTLGTRLNDILTGAKSAPAADTGLTPAAQSMGALASQNLARPTDSGVTAAAPTAADQQIPPAQPPAAPVSDKDRGPLLPRLLSSGLALLPAIFLGWPLAAGGSVITGGGLIISSLLLAALPFLSTSIPLGVCLLALGAATLAAGSPVLGLLTGLGGWGLMRYNRYVDAGRRYDESAALLALFGGLAAVTGAGLALSSPAGWLAASLKAISYPGAALLLFLLPRWLGRGLVAALSGIYQSCLGVDRVESAMRRDTASYDRLRAFSKAQLDRSFWNAIWLSAIWVPIWISQLGQWLLAIAGGLIAGVMQAPVIFLWGATYNIDRASASAKFFGAWAVYMFHNGPASKKSAYNRLAAPLIPYANSKSKLIGLPALFALRLLQWLWLGHAVLGTPAAGIIGFFKAFSAKSLPGEAPSPRDLRPAKDDVPSTNQPVPEEPGHPGTPAKSTLFPRLLAAGIALLPACFIGLPWAASAGPVLGGIYLAAAASLALLPLLPEKTPVFLRSMPARMLMVLGAALLGTQPWALGSDLLKTNAFWMAISAAAGGWGFSRYLSKTIADSKSYDVENPEYIGAFFGAVAAISGLGVVLTGMTGTLPRIASVLAYLTSPLLLMHLPAWTFWGFWTLLAGLLSNFHHGDRLIQACKKHSSFHHNAGLFSRFWLNKSGWNASWLMPLVWIPFLAMQAADWAVTSAVSLALCALRLPLDFLWGVIYKAFPESGLTRLLSGTMRSWNDNLIGEDALKSFLNDGRIAPLLKINDEAVAPSYRPSFRAVLGFLTLRAAQFIWLLARLTLGTPVFFVNGLIYGFRNIRNAPSPNDDPSRYYLRK